MTKSQRVQLSTLSSPRSLYELWRESLNVRDILNVCIDNSRLSRFSRNPLKTGLADFLSIAA